MDLQQQAQIITNIREKMQSLVGERIGVLANMGRSKVIHSEGILAQVHPQLFIMDVEGRRGRKSRQSFQYADILTGTVQLSHDGQPVFEPFIIASELDAPDTLVNFDPDVLDNE